MQYLCLSIYINKPHIAALKNSISRILYESNNCGSAVLEDTYKVQWQSAGVKCRGRVQRLSKQHNLAIKKLLIRTIIQL